MGYAKRTDGNQKSIVEGLIACGFKVRVYSSLGNGIPDLCVFIKPGFCLFLELKDPSQTDKRKHELTKAEQEWMDWNAWNTRKVFTLEECIRAINAFRREVACIEMKI